MLLEAVNIQKFYNLLGSRNRLQVLKGIDFSVNEGEVVSIIGPSGAGKSTLLHILGGLDNPDEGNVNFDSQDVYKLKDAARAKTRNEKIGFIFQFYHLLPEFTALENVILPAMIKINKGDPKQFHEQGSVLLGQVGLKERATHKPYQLSGGEQQRVAIARALMNKPKIIFCDEPTGNLDSQTGEEIIELLLESNRRHKQALVIVTHDEGISQRSHRSVFIRDGKLTNG